LLVTIMCLKFHLYPSDETKISGKYGGKSPK